MRITIEFKITMFITAALAIWDASETLRSISASLHS